MTARARRLQRRGSATLALAVVLAGAAPAAAQTPPDPLRFLRPWLEKQLGVTGEDEAPPAAVPPAPGESTGAAPEPGSIPDSDPPAAAAAAAPSAESDPSAAAEVPADSPAPPAPDADPPAPATAESDLPGGEAPAGAAPAGEEPATPLEAGPQPLRLGVLAGREVAATMAALQPVSDDLTRILSRPVEILPLVSYAAMIDAQIQRRIDGGFYSASAFAAAEAECRCLDPLAAPAAFDGSIAYYAVVVVRAGSGIQSAGGLQGKVVAVGPEASLGSRRMQLAGLLAEGIDPGRFGAVREVESADQGVDLVLAGQADAAFAWSSMTGDLQAGYSRGTLRDVLARNGVAMSDLAVIWRSAPITHGPLAVLDSLPEPEKQAIESYLVGLARSAPAAYDILTPFYSGGYLAVDREDYSGLSALLSDDLANLSLPAPQPAAARD